MKLARITSLIILSLIITVACSTKEVKKDSQLPAGVEEKSVNAYMEQGKSFEECIEVNPGQVLHYSFNASQDVYFDIHYHGMQGRKIAIMKNQVRSFNGELIVDEIDFYDKVQKKFCLIWTNNFTESPARLKLNYYVTSGS